MAKKTLLSEGQVRHFMKLASIAPLAETFLSEMEDLTEEEEEALELDDADALDAEADADREEAHGLEDEADAADDEADADRGAATEEAFEELAQNLAALAGTLGIDVAVSGGEEVAADVDAEAEEGEIVEDAPLAEAVPALEDEAVEECGDAGLYEELNENVKVINDEKIVKEVAARVAKRLLEESRQDQLAESLAKRIAEKLR